MPVLSWRYFEVLFRLLCSAATIGTVSWCIYLYLLDEDVTLVDFKTFHDTILDFYPSTSICLTVPYNDTKLQKYGNHVKGFSYSEFLGGKFWSDTMANIPYDEVALNPKDHFLSYRLMLRNGSIYSGNFGKNDNANSTPKWPLPFVSFTTFNTRCFGFDAPFIEGQKIVRYEAKVNGEIFPKRVRPNIENWWFNERTFLILLHYRNQLLRTQSWKDRWPTRSNQSSESYQISLDVSSMEVVQSRSKRNHMCNEVLTDYDDNVFESVITSVGCKPMYFTLNNSLPWCTAKEQMKRIGELHLSYFAIDNVDHIRCRRLEKLQFAATEHDVEASATPTITIELSYKDLTYKEIKKVRAYGTQTLIGNAGGYLGLFVGYTLVSFPDMLKSAVKFINHLILPQMDA